MGKKKRTSLFIFRPLKKFIVFDSAYLFKVSLRQLDSQFLSKIKKKNTLKLKKIVNPFKIRRRRYMTRRKWLRLRRLAYKPNLQKLSKKQLKSKKKRKKKKKIPKHLKAVVNRKLSKKRKKLKKKKKKSPFAKQVSKGLVFTRYHKGRNRQTSYSKLYAERLHFGLVGFKILKSAKLRAKQLFFYKQAMIRIIAGKKKKRKKRIVRIWDYLLSDVPVSKKPDEIRMGKGKGSVDHWMTRSPKGKVLFEFNTIKKKIAFRGLSKFGKLISKPYLILYKNLQKWSGKFK